MAAQNPMQNPILSTFATTARQVWYWPVIRGVIAIIFGIIALVAPIDTAVALAVVIGIFAIIDGIVEIVDGIRYRDHGGVALRVTIGVLTLIFGIVVLAWPGITIAVLVYTVAIWSIVVGLFQVVVSIGLRSVPGSGWGWGVLAGVLGIAFGVLVLVNVGAGLVTIIWIIGIYAIVLGVALVVLGFSLRSLGKKAAAATETPR
ncbi:HdeD family acid-resistance protein [Oerskovia flava]|uniref:HdeD family acid-resistance protein n=1 Tax=Oerskovia flava TaxID=2986422 RepID=UPI00224003CB|nr:HdeD family acid-resistance protein [Oerskovia sp. JB1-3-2]